MPLPKHSVGTPAQRRTFLGGSDAAACLNISPWSTPYRLWCEKSGIELPPDLSNIDYIYFGNLLEPVVARVFAERVGMKVRVEPKLYRHKKYPFMGGHIDRRILNERAFLECKTANAFDYRDWGKTGDAAGGVPEHYLAQVDHYMAVLDCTHCYVAVLIGGSEFRWYRVERDKKRETKLIAAEVALWNMVRKNTPPDVANEKDAKHRWQKMLEGTAVDVGMSERTKIVKLATVAQKIRDLEKEEKSLRDWIFPLFADKEYISMQGEALARVSSFERSYFDKDALAKKQPKVVAKYTEQRLTKRLKILI